MGNSSSSTATVGGPPAPPAPAVQPVEQAKVCPVSKSPVSSGSKCPFGFGGEEAAPAVAPVETASLSQPAPAAPSGCPVQQRPSSNETPGEQGCPVRRKGGGYKNKDVYNVYSQKIDPTNNMPALANQQMAPGQQEPLSVQRVQSGIPKGGTDDDTWLYPSPQMFWNAIVRKNKAEDSEEEIKHMETVVAIHNNMNEKTWKQIMSWEKLYEEYHHSDGAEPKLLRFIGRPDEMTPKAKLRTLLGQPAPFDRHDWTVDRGGKLVRYVIDYYFDEDAVGNDSVPTDKSDVSAVRSIRVDARPALDSPYAVVDQFVYMPMQTLLGKTEYSPPPVFSNINLLGSLQKVLESPAKIELSKSDVMQRNWAVIQEQCEAAKLELSKCSSAEDEAACRGAKSIALQRCTARVVCPDMAKAFDAAVRAETTDASLDNIGKAYGDMATCLDNFYEDSKDYLSGGEKK